MPSPTSTSRHAARRYGKVGGFAHLATLVKRLKASRPGALLLDGGDTWQGSATALWTNGQDMVDAAKLLGVDVMTGHWEFTYGMERVKEIVEKDFKGRIDFVAQNVKTADFGDPVFKPYVLREINGVPVRHHRPGLPVHADRQPALLGGRLELRHPGREPAEDGRRGARQGRAGRRAAVAQRHGRRPEAGLPRARHRRHPRRPHARRRAGRRAGRRQPGRQDAGDQRRQQRQVPRRDGLRRARTARWPTSATACCRCSPTCCRPTRRWTR